MSDYPRLRDKMLRQFRDKVKLDAVPKSSPAPADVTKKLHVDEVIEAVGGLMKVKEEEDKP